MALTDVMHWLNETVFSQNLRESEIAFPLTEAIHLIGLGVSVGTIFWVDLRLLGRVMTGIRVSEVISRLEPWAKAGFAVMFVSGLLLFLGKPDNYYSTSAFKLKMVLLPLAGLNVLFFHKRVFPHVAAWDARPMPPWQGRAVGAVSISLWLVIIVLGRWTAYFADPLYKSMHFKLVLMDLLLPDAFFSWCSSTWIGTYIAHSVWTMPILETVHIMGLVVLLGAAFALNLTVLGVGIRVPGQALARQLFPWALGGVCLAIVTGIPMFLSAASQDGHSGPFAIKMLLLVSAIALQVAIHAVRGLYESTLGRVAACLSLLCWFGIAYAGRAIAFSNLLGL